jgi:diguanylate cyclase (GGDEF)-like protein
LPYSNVENPHNPLNQLAVTTWQANCFWQFDHFTIGSGDRMPRVKISRATAIPPQTDGLLATGDTATARFRHFASNDGLIARPDRLLAGALNYADETEQRIMELNARIALLESLTITDELTGLLNRRGFADVMQRNLLSAARYDEAGILAYIDLDNFKGTNDNFGHQVGDRVLRAVGRYLLQNVRATDYAARLGGDEFAILFVRAQQAPARERARQLVRGLNKLSIKSDDGKVSIRASLGLAYYDGEITADELLDRADRAMYADKHKGGRAARLVING